MSESATSPSPNSGQTGGKFRTVLLLAVLGVLLIALGYDYLVARPRVSEAYDEIAERYTEVNATADDILTNEEIREMLGKEPSRTFSEGRERVEVYSWTSGVPFRTHDLFVVFTKSGDEQMFRRHSKFAYEPVSEVSMQNEVGEGDPNETPPSYGGGGEPAPGGGEPAPGGGEPAPESGPSGDGPTEPQEAQGEESQAGPDASPSSAPAAEEPGNEPSAETDPPEEAS